MADPFVAEIRIYPFNFAPTGWAFCDGQLLPVSQNTALFSLLGTTYGGNGTSTFALPNLQDRAPMHPGQGSGLSLRVLGQEGGAETVTLLASEIPVHTHTLTAQGAPGDTSSPDNAAYARAIGATPYDAPPAGPQVAMAPEAIAPVGGDLPHNNMQPFLTLNFSIALQGIFPPRS